MRPNSTTHRLKRAGSPPLHDTRIAGEAVGRTSLRPAFDQFVLPKIRISNTQSVLTHATLDS